MRERRREDVHVCEARAHIRHHARRLPLREACTARRRAARLPLPALHLLPQVAAGTVFHDQVDEARLVPWPVPQQLHDVRVAAASRQGLAQAAPEADLPRHLVRRLLLGGVDALDSHLVRVRVGLTVGARLRVKAGVTVGVRLRVRVRDGFRVAG